MSSFKFSPDSAPQTQFYTDVQTLNHLNEAQLSQFLAIILGLISGKSVETDVDGFAAQHGANLKSLTSTVQTLLHIITEGMKRSLKEADVASDLKELGLDSAKAAAVGKLYSAELGAMSAAVASATFKVNQLVDMEWKFGGTSCVSFSLAQSSLINICCLPQHLPSNRSRSNERLVLYY